MLDPADRLCHVLADQAFPACRWELIATAQAYGADAQSHAELHALPIACYTSLTHVVREVERVVGQASSGTVTARRKIHFPSSPTPSLWGQRGQVAGAARVAACPTRSVQCSTR